MDLGEGGLDPLSLGLEIRQRLIEQNPDMMFWRVDEDEVKDQLFRVLDPDMLETSLGCLKTRPIERVHGNSKRFTRAWHAPDLDYIYVRLEHGKIDGNHVEMRITELTLGDTKVLPQPGCTALQAGSISSEAGEPQSATPDS
jgi:hypothetical protein